MKSYKALKQQQFTSGEYSIVPIRSEDRYDIMEWRNEQMFHLRQNKILTNDDQDEYFKKIVAKLFDMEEPDQILFSFLKDGNCIGYGGLVHINWIDKNAEISFLVDTNSGNENFKIYWYNFLMLLENVAWHQLNLHKIYTYAFDLRPNLYSILEEAGFAIDAVLKEHSFFTDKFIDVIIHSKFNKDNELRAASFSDLNLTFKWANTPKIRAFSYNKGLISFKEHTNWFLDKLESSNCEYYILEVNGIPAGSIRFDLKQGHRAKINYLLDENFSGKGLGTYLLKEGLIFLKKNKPFVQVAYGYVLKENMASIKIFEKLSFEKISEDNSELKFKKSF